MRIELLDPATATEQDVDGLHAVQVAATAADRPGNPPPARADVAARLRTARADLRRPRWAARTGAGILGHATLRMSMLDNLHLGMVDVVEVLTGNAASNTHMLHINERLGFREHWAILGFQGEVAALADRLEGRRPC